MTAAQTAHFKKAFLESFRVTGNVSESCRAIGLDNRRAIYNWQEHDDVFLLQYREAEIQATEVLETEARVRATAGSQEPVFHQGEVVGHIWKKSDTLLIFLLKARAPEKYRDRVQLQHADAEGKRLPLGAVETYVQEALGARR